MKISIREVTKKFGDVLAVDKLSVDIGDGEFFFFLGPSGCGKTTMLRMIAGFDKPTSGMVCFNEKDLTYCPPNKRNVGMVFQNYALWPHMSVFKNVEYGLKLRKLPTSEIKDRVFSVLKMVRMDGYDKRNPNQLSGGQQQRVALARAIVINPDVLLFDEPLSNLDAKLRLEMRDEIRRIQHEMKITTIYVTHDQKEALSMGDTVAVMKEGRIVQMGAPRQLHREPVNSFVANFIGETNFLHAQVASVSSEKIEIAVAEFSGQTLISKRGYKGLKAGDSVLVSIRPESIHFVEAVAPDESYNRLPCQVESVTYLGEMEQYSLRLKGHQHSVKSLHLNPFLQRETGQEEEVFIHPKDVTLLQS